MLIGPNTTADQVKAKITELSKKASRLPRASDDWVRHHADIYRLQGVLDGMLKRDAETDDSRRRRALDALVAESETDDSYPLTAGPPRDGK